jgi:hypothetical protein
MKRFHAGPVMAAVNWRLSPADSTAFWASGKNGSSSGSCRRIQQYDNRLVYLRGGSTAMMRNGKLSEETCILELQSLLDRYGEKQVTSRLAALVGRRKIERAREDYFLGLAIMSAPTPEIEM